MNESTVKNDRLPDLRVQTAIWFLIFRLEHPTPSVREVTHGLEYMDLRHGLDSPVYLSSSKVRTGRAFRNHFGVHTL